MASAAPCRKRGAWETRDGEEQRATDKHQAKAEESDLHDERRARWRPDGQDLHELEGHDDDPGKGCGGRAQAAAADEEDGCQQGTAADDAEKGQAGKEEAREDGAHQLLDRRCVEAGQQHDATGDGGEAQKARQENERSTEGGSKAVHGTSATRDMYGLSLRKS